MGNGRAGLRIERMRVAHAVLLEIITVIPRGGNTVTIQLQNLLCHPLIVARRLDGDAPGLPIRLLARALELPGDVHQVAVDTQLGQAADDSFDRITGGDTVEIQLQIDVLAQLLPVYAQVPITAAQPRLRPLLGAPPTPDPP